MNTCTNLIKLSIIHNKKGLILKNNKISISILKCYLKINLIKFIKIYKNKIIVYINYINNKPVFSNLLNLYKPSNKKIISLKNLKKINKKYNWILIISTNKGIMNNFEAIKNNSGGLLLSKMWN